MNKEDPEITREIFRRTRENSEDNIQAKDPFSLQISSKDTRLQILQDPMNSVL
jgi:hypothetical protein